MYLVFCALLSAFIIEINIFTCLYNLMSFSCTLYLCTISIIPLGLISAIFYLYLPTIIWGFFDCSWEFPSVLMVYQTIAVLFFSTVDLVSYATVKELVCSSRDLVESLEVQNSTPFCIFGGKR